MTTTTSSSAEQSVPRWRLWFGIVAPTVVWAVHGLASYYLTMEICHLHQPNLAAGRAALIALSVAALAVAVAGAVLAWRSWRKLTHQRLIDGEGHKVPEMLALGGVFVSASFIVGILWGGLPSILLLQSLCERWR